MHVDYGLLSGGMETLALNWTLGSEAGVLPFAVVVDCTGKQVYVHASALTEAGLDAAPRRLL